MNRQQPTSRRSGGFTLIELLIATVVFSLVLLVITTSILQFSKQYYKGVVASSTQGVTRSLIDDVSQSLKFNGNYAALSGGNGYCVGTSKRYSFALNKQVEDSGTLSAHQARHGLVSDTVANCNSATPALTFGASSAFPGSVVNSRELLGQHMRLAKFSITNPAEGMYIVTVRFIYGDDDLLTSATSPDANCKSTACSQFCATSELTTTVMKRVK